MLLPTKGVSQERALITVGSEVLDLLRSPTSVSSLWDRFAKEHGASRDSERITFDWFSLALSALYMLDLIEWTDDGYVRRRNVR